MRCPSCGADISPNDRFCPNCGSPVDPSKTLEEAWMTPGEPSPTQPQPPLPQPPLPQPPLTGQAPPPSPLSDQAQMPAAAAFEPDTASKVLAISIMVYPLVGYLLNWFFSNTTWGYSQEAPILLLITTILYLPLAVLFLLNGFRSLRLPKGAIGSKNPRYRVLLGWASILLGVSLLYSMVVPWLLADNPIYSDSALISPGISNGSFFTLLELLDNALTIAAGVLFIIVPSQAKKQGIRLGFYYLPGILIIAHMVASFLWGFILFILIAFGFRTYLVFNLVSAFIGLLSLAARVSIGICMIIKPKAVINQPVHIYKAT